MRHSTDDEKLPSGSFLKAAPVLMAAACCSLLGNSPARAENLLSVYGGSSFTRDSDLHIRQGAVGTGATLHDVEWSARPLAQAPYYGLRYTHFLSAYPSWGVALDFTHYKVYANTGRSLQVDGTWRGAAVNTRAPMRDFVQQFEISHGVNMLSVNGIYRWIDSSFIGGKLQPYVGAGIAHYWMHSENAVGGVAHETGYQASGFGYQILGGLQYQLTSRVSAFLEAKYNHGTATVNVANGEAETTLNTFHALGGLSLAF